MKHLILCLGILSLLVLPLSSCDRAEQPPESTMEEPAQTATEGTQGVGEEGVQEAAETVEGVKQQAEEAVEDAKQQLEDVKQQSEEMVESAKDTAAEMAAEATEKPQGAVDDTMGTAEGMSGDAQKEVEGLLNP